MNWKALHLLDRFSSPWEVFLASINIYQKLCFKLHVRYYTKDSKMTKSLFWGIRYLNNIFNNVISTIIEICTRRTMNSGKMGQWNKGREDSTVKETLELTLKGFMGSSWHAEAGEEGFWTEGVVITMAPETGKNKMCSSHGEEFSMTGG